MLQVVNLYLVLKTLQKTQLNRKSKASENDKRFQFFHIDLKYIIHNLTEGYLLETILA